MWTWLWLVACQGDDPDNKRNPACVDEIPYDGIDQDCTGGDLVDVDADGFDATEAGGDDCDDTNAAISPDAAEIPYDGIDQDCADGDLVDADGDEHSAVAQGGDDCDDTDPNVFPGASDSVGNSIDEDCDGSDGTDVDLDGYPSVNSGGTDCDDNNNDIYPDATEIWHDGVDQNCDQQCDGDEDGDGAVLPGTPINNNSPCDIVAGPEAYAPEDCNDQDPIVQEFGVYDFDPANGAIGVPVIEVLRAEFYGEDPSLSATITDAAGDPVAGSVVVSSYFLTFTPDVPFDFFSTYTLQVDSSCGTFTSAFTTEDEPVPVDATGLLLRTYEVNLGSGEWVEPEGIGSLLASEIGDLTTLIEILAVDTDTLDLRFAGGYASEQDLCIPTQDQLGVDFTSNPYVTLDPTDLSLWFGGIELPLEGAHLSGRFQSDSAAIVGASLAGNIDTRPLGEAFGLGTDPNVLCDLIATFGVPCAPCADGSGDYCMPILITDLSAQEIDIDTVPRTEEDVAADTGCP